MNLHQPLPTSCYLNTSENSTASKSNLNSIAPKLQKRKQRLHLGAKKVDPALFLMMERENEKKILKNGGTTRSVVDIRTTSTKSVSTEEQDSEEESNVSQDEHEPHESYRRQSRSDGHVAEHNISLMKQNVSRNDCPAKTNEDHTINPAGYQPTYRNVESVIPKLNATSTDEFQKKFGSAKSISSERYFNDIGGTAEYKSDLSRFTNCSAISSDDLFNREPYGYESNLQDFFFSSVDNISYEELAACLKNGVTKVAGKLGSVLSSFASRLPHEFGEY